MSKYSALFESNSSNLVQSKYDALFNEEVLPTDTQSVSKYDLLFEDNTPTAPQVEQTVSPDLKEKIDEAPWYESMLYEFNKFKFNALFGGAEGVGELASSVGELFGADIDNPLASDKPNLFRDAMGAMHGVSQKEFQESTVRDVARVGTQLGMGGGVVKGLTSIPKVASALKSVPKAVKLPVGAALTEFIALSADEKGLSDAIGMGPLQKEEGESVFMGKLKNAGEGLAMFGGLKAAGKVADKTLVPAVNKTFSVIEKGLEKVDPYIRPIKSKIKELDPFVASRMDKFELDNLMLKQNFVDQMQPFADQFKKLSKDEQKLFQRLTSNPDSMKKAFDMLDKVQKRKGMDGIKANFLNVRRGLDDLHKLANDNGIKIEYREDYLPRVMKDYDGFVKSLGKEPRSQLEEMFRAAEKKKFDDMPEKMKQSVSLEDTKLSEAERAKVIQNYFEGNNLRGSGKMGLQKERVLASITDDTQKYYDDFLGGLQKYVDNVTYNVNKNRFLGKSQDPTAKSIFTDIERIEDGKVQDEITKLISTRFKGGEARIGKGTNIARNVIYASTIANPYSTITQLGDLALNSYRNGLINTLSPFGPKIKLKEFGLNDIASEFTDAGAVKGAMDKLFKVTGFKKIDIALKENNLRGAFRQAQGQLRNKNSKAYKKFIEENKPFFQNETDDLIDAIRRGDSQNENVRHYLFSRLTKTQPITLSEMPAKYLNMKGGRLFYSLKTFFVKQLDVMREDIVQKLAKRETSKEGMQNAARFAMLFGGGTAAVNATKDLILGRPVEISDELMDVAMQMIGISKYAIYKAKSDGLTGGATAVLAPPMPIVNEAFKVLAADDKEEALKKQSKELVRYIPVVGKDIYWRFGAGEEKIKQDRLDRLRGKD
jgi:hypothetical protein